MVRKLILCGFLNIANQFLKVLLQFLDAVIIFHGIYPFLLSFDDGHCEILPFGLLLLSEFEVALLVFSHLIALGLKLKFQLL